MWTELQSRFQELIPYFPMKISWDALISKIAIVLTISAVSAASIYKINTLLKDSRSKDVLGLSDTATIWKWIGGAVLTTLILYGLQIIAFKIQAIVLVAFVWDKFFEKMYNSAQTNIDKDKRDIASIGPENVEDITTE